VHLECHQQRFFTLKCTKIFGGWGFAPHPTGGVYNAPPDPLPGLRDPLLMGGEKEGGKGRRREWGGTLDPHNVGNRLTPLSTYIAVKIRSF